MVNLAKIDLLWVLLDEGEDILLAEAMNVVAVAIVPLVSLSSVPEPAVGNPFLNLVLVLAQAFF